MVKLSVKESLRAGWSTFKSRPWIFVQAGLVLFALHFLISLGQSFFDRQNEITAGDPVIIFGGFAVSILAILVSFLISMGEANFFLRAQKETSHVSLKDLWRPHPFLKFVLASLLAGIIIILGLILLIVPGIILGILLMFFPFVVLEKNLGPVAALKESFALTKGNRWSIFWLSLAMLGINILGILALVVGLFVTVPVTYLATIHAYRTLSRGISEKPVSSPDPVTA